MPSNRLSRLLGITTFGESHGPAIGILVDSPKPLLPFPPPELEELLNRRRTHTPYGSSRVEGDEIEILSGVFDGKTTGMPLCVIIRNTNIQSEDYEDLKNVFRPGHADFSWFNKFGIYDYRGGGRASGRETIARVLASSLVGSMISDVSLEVHTIQIGELHATQGKTNANENPFHWQDADTLDELYCYLDTVKAEGDSLGGVVRVRAKNIPIGLGDPVYEKLSANIAKAMLSIGTVKGILFGDAMRVVENRGSQVNDQMDENGFLSNHLGGIVGGVTNGNDLVFDLFIRPISSVSKPQSTITHDAKVQTIRIKGRHDVCHIPRLIPVVEAMFKLTLADAIQYNKLLQGDHQDLSTFRESIDKLDEDLLLLLYQRKKIVNQVKQYKEAHHIPRRDLGRETEIQQRLIDFAKELELDSSVIGELVSCILRICK